MHVHIKITTEANQEPCLLCGKDPVLGTCSLLYHVQTTEGLDTCGPYCFRCLNTPGLEMTAVITPPEAPPYRPTPPSRRIKKRSQQQERTIAEDIGGRTSAGSGNQPGYKGDVRKKGQYRIEAKLTESKQYILKLETLDKISSECNGLERPALIVDFVGRSLRTTGAWAIIPYEDFKDIANAPPQHR